nr:mucin-17 [Biomphalaria glabrata]
MARVNSVIVGLILASTLRISVSQSDPQAEIKRLKNVISALGRQVMLQQFAQEEKLRSDGWSGLKQIRVDNDGPRNYHTNSHSGGSMGAIHDHSNNQITVGQGEGQFVLNGVEFRTRHNDYQLRMPSPKSSAYHVMSEIPFPPVPRQVLDKPSVQEQIVEMREWFKAWRDQNFSVRDYRPYFKPLLCYLEGAWTTNTKELEEPFFSDRHSLDATSWFDLQERVRYSAYTGRKSLDENFAYLPTAIINITDSGVPVYAQWNYRMLCHPLSKDLPTSYLKPVDDLSVRLPRGQTLEQYLTTRGARFSVVGPKDKANWQYLDDMMGEVPGKDNYGANITDSTFGMKLLHSAPGNDSRFNVGFYHRRYRVEKADAMGLSYSRRGYSDPSIFMAETTQEKIAEFYIKQCSATKVCYESKKRMSYAIPLEIIYLTPLSTWNPYDIPLYSNKDKNIVINNGKRNGGLNINNAFNGSLYNQFYRTPIQFFSGGEVGSTAADTVKGSVGVLDKNNTVRSMSASGVRIFLPNIPGVGVLRTRYPITPVHAEGSSVWKELNALKDIVLKLASYERLLTEKIPRTPEVKPIASSPTTQRTSPKPVTSTSTALPKTPTTLTPKYPIQQQLTLMTTTIFQNPPGEHYHTIEMTKDEQERLQKGEVVDFITSQDNAHSHAVKVQFYNGRYHVTKCDSKAIPCWDGHTSCLMKEGERGCPIDNGLP